MTVLLFNASARKQGNTATLGERLLTDIPHTTIHLMDHHLNFVQDNRDTGRPQADPTDDYESLMAQFATANDIVLATPVYWYDMAAPLKVFMDRWFDSYTNGFPFAGKRVYLLIVGADQPEIKAAGIANAVRYSCAWLKMDFCGVTTVTADGPHDIAAMTTFPASFGALRLNLEKIV
ncbi:flavodoxin family protein [Levilactobacillus fujinensis]|uniref:Flavodoxin family protein n=1 Tax=Levilactobacillus fujinensis TaxID=2486024 RepID=A0ABW1TH91_9LACO|nr:NAD(P)H-dependent oxidoreductase [Levilactobacillus fujinensis]